MQSKPHLISKKFIFLILLFVYLGHGQVSQEWTARYNGPANSPDAARSMAIDDLGNIYVTGKSDGSNGNSDYLTVKYSPDGNQLWTARYNGPGNSSDEAVAILVDGMGNVYITGYSSGFSSNSSTSYDYATIKYDSEGNELWIARYDGPINGEDIARSIAVDGLGNVYVTGGSRPVATSTDYATIKYDSDGNELWVSRYNGPGNSFDDANAISVDSSGYVYITGRSFGNGSLLDYATIKYDTDGNEIWISRYNGPSNNNDAGTRLVIDDIGNIYVTGNSAENRPSSADYATIKYDPDGNQLWVSNYNGPGDTDDFVQSIAVNNSGEVIVTGFSGGTNSEFDYATLKYDANGNEQWLSRFNGPGNSRDYATSMKLDGLGNIYVTGYSTGIGSAFDYTTIKYDANGSEQWLSRYTGSGNSNDYARSLVLDSAGNVYVAGSSSNDFLTVKYSQDICEPLPSPWLNSDIGDVAVSGNACYEPTTGTFEIEASGENIWNLADEFHYVYQELTGDGEIIARVVSQENTFDWTKAGVMIRNGTDPDAEFALMTMLPNPADLGPAYAFQYRDVRGEYLDGSNNLGFTLVDGYPYYVRLVRDGDTITGYASATNGDWQFVGSAPIVMEETILIGLAVTSHNDGVLNKSVFDNVLVSGDTEIDEDTTPPEISLNGDSTLTLQVGDTYVEPGATATDNVDGDISGNIIIDDSGVDSDTAGIYEVTYDVIDDAGNSAATVTRTIIIEEAPILLEPIINEFTTEYIEVFAEGDADYSNYTIILIDSNTPNQSSWGQIYRTFDLGITDSNGYLVIPFVDEGFLNLSRTYLLVKDFDGAVGDYVDLDADGTIDNLQWSSIVDDVAYYLVYTSTNNSAIYSSTVLLRRLPNIPDIPLNLATGYSRIPNGLDTDSSSDWAPHGIPEPGKAEDTPGAENKLLVIGDECGPLPAPWSNSDIGDVGAAGSACYNPVTGTFEIEASGENIWNLADEFHYVYQELTGDGEIIARVVSQENTFDWTKAGVMMRNGTEPDAEFALMTMLPNPADLGPAYAFQYRDVRGEYLDGSNNLGLAFVNDYPYYVRLVREGDTITGYASEINGDWQFVGSAPIAMEETILVGLAVTAHNDGILNKSVFDNVSVNGDSQTIVYETIANGNWEEAAIWLNGEVPPNPIPEGTRVIVDHLVFMGEETSFINNGLIEIPNSEGQLQIEGLLDNEGQIIAGPLPNTKINRSSVNVLGTLNNTGLVKIEVEQPSGNAYFEGTINNLAGGILESEDFILLRGNSVNQQGAIIRVSNAATGRSATLSLIEAILDNEGIVEVQDDCSLSVRTGSIFNNNESGIIDNYGGFTVGFGGATMNNFGLFDNKQGASISAGSFRGVGFIDSQFGRIRNSGRISTYAEGEFFGELIFSNTTLEGDGLIYGRTRNSRPGIARITGVLDSPGILYYEIIGAEFGEFSTIRVEGTANLDRSTLQVILENVSSLGTVSYNPLVGDQFEILTATDGVNSQFANLDLPDISSGLGWEVIYESNRVLLRVVESVGCGPIPAPWTNSDIGAVGATGDACYDASTGIFEVTGSGENIWNLADEFHFVYQELEGDGEIIARVLSQENTFDWTKAGVMMRNGSDAGAEFAMMMMLPNPADLGTAYAFQYRDVRGEYLDGSNNVGLTVVGSYPYYIRLVRIGDVISGYASTTNGNWQFVGSAPIAMEDTIQVGLAVTSHNDGVLNTSTFDEVSVTSFAPVPLVISNNMSISPNPANVSAIVSFEEPEFVEEILIFDMSGRVIQRFDANKIRTGDHFEMNVYPLPVGTYIVRAESPSGFQYNKQMVIKR